MIPAAAALTLLCGGLGSVAFAAPPEAAASAPNSNYTVYVYPQGQGTAEMQIRQTLTEWAAAAANNDVEGETHFYAAEVSRYFLRRNVSNAFVRHDKEALRQRGEHLQSFTIDNVSVEVSSPSEASASLVKSWVLATHSGTPRTGTTRSRLWLRRTGTADWKIVGEQDLKPPQSPGNSSLPGSP